MKAHNRTHEIIEVDTRFTVLTSIAENPTISVRQIITTLNDMKKKKFHLYQSIRCQHLMNKTVKTQRNLLSGPWQNMRKTIIFLNHLLFSDESCFTNTEIAGGHDHHHYATENLRLLIVRDKPTSF